MSISVSFKSSIGQVSDNRYADNLLFTGDCLDVLSSPGDIVFDCFGGSGTTAAVAHKMNRRWLTSEILEETVNNYITPRLSKIIRGVDFGGITANQSWEGGGGYRKILVAKHH